jgi:Zn-dependent M28 family amino/carboxypeptidase
MLVVEFSPGGSDDGSGVVILLEILSNLVNDPLITFSQVHLIVLFTSAEEMSLRGAEAFVAEHQWKNDIRRFINIDSTGGNEKAILFRVKPSQVYFPSFFLQ